VKHLVHLPNKDWTSKPDAAKVAAAGVKVLGTVGFGSPVFGVFAQDNKPRFRDGKDWPSGIIDGVRLGEEAGYMPVNARTIWDAGAVLGYCTDTTYDPLAGLDHELKILNVMFSPQDMVKMMGPNSASYVEMGDQIGTLEPGKLADIVLLDGNPLEGYWNWLKTKVVLKGGKVVVDKR
jgi:imidazolonepropionase-like amidohydrolase